MAVATPELHAAFFAAVGVPLRDEDPANKLLDVHTQVGWLSEIGYRNADCFWKWRELALIAGWKP